MNLVHPYWILLKVLFIISAHIGVARDAFMDLKGTAKYHMLMVSSSEPNENCMLDVSSITPITLDITTINSTCGNSNGSIFAIASGGVAPYTYTLSDIYETYPAKQTGNFPLLFARTYVLLVEDSNGSTVTETITIENDMEPVRLSLLSTKSTSCTEPIGAVYVEATGGRPPYLYSMDDVNYQSSNAFENLSMGMYRFFVIDANGCKSIFNHGHAMPSGCFLTSSASYSQQVCDDEGWISIHADGPDGPYQYSIDGVSFGETREFYNLGVGVTTVYVKDRNGKLYMMAFSRSKSCSVNLTYISIDAACGENDGILTITAENGVQPYTYTIDGIHYQSSNTFTGLSPGLYSVTVKDASGTLSSLDATVYDHCPTVAGVLTSPACTGNDAIVTAEGNKGTQPYQFSINGGAFQDSDTFENLAEGTHSITIRDARGFTATTEIKATRCIQIASTTIPTVCSSNTGQITVSANGGTAPYYYSINGSGYRSANTFTGLAPGDYTITVLDNVGNPGSAIVTIHDTPGPSFSAQVLPVSCSGNDGEVQLNVSGGTAPFRYSIDGIDFQDQDLFDGLNSGQYHGIVTDLNGCRYEAEISVPVNCIQLDITTQNSVCGAGNGSISAVASDGIAPYQYSLNGIDLQDDGRFMDIVPGTYTVTVRAADGKTTELEALVEDACISIAVIPIDATCGFANGSIQVTATNGVAPYTYSVDGVDFRDENIIADLVSGAYRVVVKDANGMINEIDIVIDDLPGPKVLTSTQPASCLDNDGEITLVPSGGKWPYLYSMDGIDFQVDSIFSYVPHGSYTVTVKDSYGCPVTVPADVGFVDNLELHAGDNLIICEGETAVLPLSSNAQVHTWAPTATLSNHLSSQPIAAPHLTTTYLVTATLGKCTTEGSITVFVNPAPVADAGKDTTICYGQSAMLTGSGGVAYQWSPETYLSNARLSNPGVVRPQASTEYNLIVKDINGCASIQPANVMVTVTPPPLLFAGNDTSIVINQPFQLNAEDLNNSGFAEFIWSPNWGLNATGLQQPHATLDRDMFYTVRAVTPAGCEGRDDIHIKVYNGPEIYVPSAFTPNSDGLNDVLKAIPVGLKEFNYFAVYDRWGKQVFYTKNPKIGWDGRIERAQQGTSAFVWVGEGIDYNGRVFKKTGIVTIIR